MQDKKYPILPADDAVQNWFEENIDKECSASSAIYKFRLWLESLQCKAITGAVWVRASERLPGYETPVKWRDGKDHSHATDGKIPLIHMAKPFLTGWEWEDESGTAAGIKQINRDWICDILIEFTIAYNRSANKDVANDAAEYLSDKLKEAGVEYVLSEDERPAAGREEDAVAFAEWLRTFDLLDKQNGQWVLESQVSTAQLYKLFKQKEK